MTGGDVVLKPLPQADEQVESRPAVVLIALLESNFRLDAAP